MDYSMFDLRNVLCCRLRARLDGMDLTVAVIDSWAARLLASPLPWRFLMPVMSPNQVSDLTACPRVHGNFTRAPRSTLTGVV